MRAQGGRYTTHRRCEDRSEIGLEAVGAAAESEAAAPCQHDVDGYQRPRSLERHGRERERFRMAHILDHKRVTALDAGAAIVHYF